MTAEHPRDISFTVPIVVERDGDGYHAYCPPLRGLHTCGATEEEAVGAAVDAAGLHLQSMLRHHEPIPLQVCVDAGDTTCHAPRGKGVHRVNQELSVAIA